MKPSTVAPIGCFDVKNYPMGLFGWHYLVFHWLLRVARETWSKFPPQNIPMVQHRPNLKPIERRSVTSHSHGSKFSGSLQSFLTETVKVRLNDWRKVWATVLFLRAVIHVSFLVFFCHMCSITVCWDPENFATIANWRNDFSSLFRRLLHAWTKEIVDVCRLVSVYKLPCDKYCIPFKVNHFINLN